MKQILQSIVSWVNVAKIEMQRFVDQSWSKLTGLPQLKRSQITPSLFLGGQYAPRRLSTLQKRGITAIVSMRTTKPRPEWAEKGLRYLHLPTPDLQAPRLTDLQKGVDFIDREVKGDGKVYIHCAHGEGRGPSMVIAYLMSTGITFEDAYTQIQKIRPFIRPTKVQVERLKEFEEKLKDS